MRGTNNFLWSRVPFRKEVFESFSEEVTVPQNTADTNNTVL